MAKNFSSIYRHYGKEQWHDTGHEVLVIIFLAQGGGKDSNQGRRFCEQFCKRRTAATKVQATQSAKAAEEKKKAADVDAKMQAAEAEFKARIAAGNDPDYSFYFNELERIADGTPEVGAKLRQGIANFIKKNGNDSRAKRWARPAQEVLARKEAERQVMSIAQQFDTNSNFGFHVYAGSALGTISGKALAKQSDRAEILSKNGVQDFFAKQEPNRPFGVTASGTKGEVQVATRTGKKYRKAVNLDGKFKNGAEAIKYFDDYVNGRVKNEKWKTILGW